MAYTMANGKEATSNGRLCYCSRIPMCGRCHGNPALDADGKGNTFCLCCGGAVQVAGRSINATIRKAAATYATLSPEDARKRDEARGADAAYDGRKWVVTGTSLDVDGWITRFTYHCTAASARDAREYGYASEHEKSRLVQAITVIAQ